MTKTNQKELSTEIEDCLKTLITEKTAELETVMEDIKSIMKEMIGSDLTNFYQGVNHLENYLKCFELKYLQTTGEMIVNNKVKSIISVNTPMNRIEVQPKMRK